VSTPRDLIRPVGNRVRGQRAVTDSLVAVGREVTACRLCPRLVRYREAVAREKKREFRSETYWGRGVPGFGDPQARLVVIGLAPAAHGSNRTGRVFTGDRSAAFLVRAFYSAGFANQPTSLHRGDGLHYRDLYLTAAVRCAPPENRPSPEELGRCLPFLERELILLGNARSILALGGFAWDASRRAAARIYGSEVPRTPFAHGAVATLGPGKPMLYASYHPSPQNTHTRKLTQEMLVDLLEQIRGSWASGSEARGRAKPGGKAA